MNKISYLPLALLLAVAASCGTHKNTNKENAAGAEKPAAEQELQAIMAIKDTIRSGDPLVLKFTVRNPADSAKKFLKWQTPFEPLLSKYLDIKDEQGQEVEYKGAMAKRMMPPPAAAYLTVGPQDSLVDNVDLLKGYAISKPAKYTITYTSENVSGLKVRQSIAFVYR